MVMNENWLGSYNCVKGVPGKFMHVSMCACVCSFVCVCACVCVQACVYVSAVCTFVVCEHVCKLFVHDF